MGRQWTPRLLGFLLIVVTGLGAVACQAGDAEEAAKEAERRAAKIAEQQEKYLEKAKRGDFDPLEVDGRQEMLDHLVSRMLEENHLAGRRFDQEMAREVFDNYLERLDPQRLHLVESDVEEFRERHELLTAGEGRPPVGRRLELAFDVFELFRERQLERIDFAMALIEEKPDLDTDGRMRADRGEADWPADRDALERVWRNSVRNEAIGLLIDGRDWEEARESLRNRYNGFRRTLAQTRADDVVENFLNAHASTLDPHSAYFSPRVGEEFDIRMTLSLEGIGAALRSQDQYATVIELVPGGPAEEDGTLGPRDRITGVAQGVDGEMIDVIGWRLDDVVQLIRGPEGSQVRLRYLPAGVAPGEPEETVVLERREVALEDQAASREIREVERDGETRRIGVITVSSFYMDMEAQRSGREDYRSTTRDVRRLLEELKDENVDAVLMDLRNNSGGSLTEATELAGLFLEEGPVVQVLDTDGQQAAAETPEGEAVWHGPLGVLVNRFSASASEIFASAVQDHGRGLVMGNQTFGKGTVQALVDLDDFAQSGPDELGQLKLTIAKFYRVSGGSIQRKGVKPDLQLPSPISSENFGERAMDNSLQWREIDAVDYRGEAVSSEVIDQVRQAHRQRVNDLPEFLEFKKQARELREASEREWLSLNLAERREEYHQAAGDEVAARDGGQQAQEAMEAQEEVLEDDDERDLLLSESVRIMADFIHALPSVIAQPG